MKKLFFILLLPFYLYSVEIEAEYKISYGIFGTLGKAETKISKENGNYTIMAKAYTEGFAKVLSNNRQEVYTSKGKIIGGNLLPLEYKKVKSTDSYIKEKKYTFDHQNKTVTLEKSEYDKKSEKSVFYEEKFKYYAPNDILSLYFNLNSLVDGKDQKEFVFHAIGAKEDNGRVDIIEPIGEELDEMKKYMDLDKNKFLKVSINQKIFSSEKGEMLINVSSNNMCNKAVLKDVIMFGDIVAKRVR